MSELSISKLKETIINWKNQLAESEYGLSITSSVEKKFELKKRIKDYEKEINRLESIISNEEEKEQSINNYQTSSTSLKYERLPIFIGPEVV